MKLTLNWLKEFVEIKDSPQKLAETLTMAGLEVESLAPASSPESGDDWVIDVAVTPNRGDCLGVIGLARELAAVRGGRLKIPRHKTSPAKSKTAEPVKVEIQSPRCCRRYSAAVVEAVQAVASPSWMISRLEACGIRAINSIVDVTNYVMLETGQPLHAFDLARLEAKRIVVRQAKEIKSFVTLDGVERELAPGDLLICDGAVPVALAGVMGGRDSEVGPGTAAVLLESAHFDPVTIRRTGKRLALHTEASHRFERGVDAEGTVQALMRAVSLFDQIGISRSPVKWIDRYPGRARPRPILLRRERVTELIGAEIKPAEIENVLKKLGCKIQRRGSAALNVISPSYRADLSREADLIEELARLHGYEKIPSTLPLVRPHSEADPILRSERNIRSYLIGEGLSEMINLPFASAEMNRRFYGLWQGDGTPVSVLNPLVQESAEMRLSLIPGLIEDLRVNLAQGINGFAGFALGKVFSLASDGSPRERHHLAGLLYGPRERRGLRTKEKPRDFLDIKGLVEGILEWMGLGPGGTLSTSAIPAFLHPGKAACLQQGGSVFGYLGEAHPDLRDEQALPPFLLFELDFDQLVQYAPRHIAVRPLPRFPSVERDLAIVVDEAFRAQQILDWIKKLNQPLIEEVKVFDQYRGAPIPDGKKSLAYTISYRAEDRTLTDGEVNAMHQDLVSKIEEIFGAQLRV